MADVLLSTELGPNGWPDGYRCVACWPSGTILPLGGRQPRLPDRFLCAGHELAFIAEHGYSSQTQSEHPWHQRSRAERVTFLNWCDNRPSHRLTL